MTFFRSLLICLALSTATTVGFAAALAPSAPPAPTNKAGTTNAPAATSPTTTPAPASSELKLDDYLKDLKAKLDLSDSEQKAIETYYANDADQLKTILNNDTLSPLQQADQVAALRDMRNTKIEALLHDLDRQHEFLKIEARYRVALTELAANGGLVAAAPPAAK
jgi:predicted lipid-binding transport protein (Tim44 family)